MPEDQIVDQSATPKGEVTQTPVEVSSAPGTETVANPEVTTTDAQPEALNEPPKWAQRRIDQLTREKHEERRQREALQAQLDSQHAAQPTDGQPSSHLTQADIDARATQIANQQIKQTKFNDACNTAYNQGKAEFTDFDQALGNFGLLGGLPPEFLEITTTIPDGHKVLYALGKNPEEASRVLALPPLQMAIEVTRLAEKVGKPAPKPVSSAPAPITPIDGTARVEADPEKMSTAEWMRWRNENLHKSSS